MHHMHLTMLKSAKMCRLGTWVVLFGWCLMLCFVGSSFAAVGSFNGTMLKGVTKLHPPFVERDTPNGPFKGFFVDLLNELAQVGNFNYTLSNSDNLIANVAHQQADFAIAIELMSTKLQNNVHFTKPYLVSAFSALVAKKQLEDAKISTFEQLVNMPGDTQKGARKHIVVGAAASGTAYRLLSASLDKIMSEAYKQILNDISQGSIMSNQEDGIRKTLTEPFAFIQEEIFNELATDKYCELTQLKLKSSDGSSKGFIIEYGIAVSRNSRHLDMFNKSILKLEENGRIDELRRRYWNRKCNGSGSLNGEKYRHLITTVCTIFSLALSLFLLS